MKAEKIVFPSSDGAHQIHAVLYLPENPARGVLQIVHGINEYKERYEDFARFMTAHGFAVGIDDHLGHGESAGGPEGYGYFGARGEEHLVEDEHRFYIALETRFPTLPYFLLGHSMGSFITRRYLVTFNHDLTGYICMGTAGYKFGLYTGRAIAEALSKRRGEGYRSVFLKKLSQTGFNSHFLNEHDDLSWLSRNVDNRTAFGHEPRAAFMFTSGGYRSLFRLIESVTGRKWASRVGKSLPILIVSGEEDPVGDYGKGPEAVYQWLKKEGVKNVQLMLYPGARHELLNETNREEVCEDLLTWMERRIADRN